MLIKIILIYLLIGAVTDLIGRLVYRDMNYTNEIKTFGDLCLYILCYIFVIMIWPLVIIAGIVKAIKGHN